MDGKTVVLNLGGKERRLVYDLNSVAEIGKRLGITVRLGSLATDLMDQELPLGSLRTLLWAGLVREEPDLTEEVVGAWVTQDNVEEVIEGFTSLFGGIGEAMGKDQEATPGLSLPTVEGVPEVVTTET